MASKNVKVDIENMSAIKKEMLEKISDIEKILIDTEKEIADSVKVFDTPTATYFRDKVTEYIDSQKHAIVQEIKPLVESCLGEIIKIYQEEYEEEQNIVATSKNSGTVATVNNSNNTSNSSNGKSDSR